jgi:heptosyltransferase III
MFQYFNPIVSAFKKDSSLRKSLRRNAGFLFKTLFRISFSRRYDKLIVITLAEHIGDIVACEPVSYHLRKLNPNAFIIWALNEKYEELVNYNPNINAVLKLSCLTEWVVLKKIFIRFIKIYDLNINGKRCSRHRISSSNSVNPKLNFFNYLDHGNLLQVGSMAAGIRDIPDYSPKFHFKEQKKERLIGHDYIIFHCQSNHEERNWTTGKWNELANRIILKYPTVHIVEIGIENIIESCSDRYHNLTGKLDFHEIAHLIHSADLFIGVESGFGHVANALSKNSIIIIGYFQKFKNYMVYSGRFARGENVSLLYHQGPLHQLEVDAVEKAVEERVSPHG